MTTKVPVELVSLDGGVVINESSADVDFRVESNNNANMLFVDGGNDRVGIGTSSPVNDLHLVGASSTAVYLKITNGSTGNTAGDGSAIGIDADGDLIIHNAEAKDAKFYTNDTNHMTLKSDGKLAVTEISHISSGNLEIGNGDEKQIFDASGATIQFQTGDSERMRILSTGLVAIGTTANTVARVYIEETESRDCLRLTNTRNPSSSAPYVATFGFNYQPNNGTSTFLSCQDDLDGSPTNRCVISSNGGIANYQSNDSDLSDERLKTDIQDAPNALDTINNLQVRTFKYHDQTDEKIHTGLIAQEVETVDSSIVNQDGWSDKAPDGEDPYKSIYNKDLMFKMLKAIQEQQEQIEQLKTEIQTLKGE
tara:strand:- start:234 stop:1331 length:1098 start_codon:yes stop_codon:yes gene_type:complete